ncbi:S8/S53 family peptidase, partial [Roseomonas rosulenta]|uniref:S8/S53 family peptidase n=1 Tax=Roseomonas rosulenta TaxID=2748667 RepID=UPI0018DFFFA9
MPTQPQSPFAPKDPLPLALSWQLAGQTFVSQDLAARINRLKNRLGPILAARSDLQPDDTFRIIIDGNEIKPPSIPGSKGAFPDFEIFDLGVLGPDVIAELEKFAKDENGSGSGLQVSLTSSLGISAARGWCPSEAGYPHLGTTGLALAQLGAGHLSGPSATGRKTFVVVVDQGINARVLRKRVPNARFAGGWWVRKPCSAAWTKAGAWADGHGTRMAEAVLSVAPEATIIDLPLLPPRIRDLRGFLPWAAWVYWSLGWVIEELRRTHPGWSCVICNAWSVYNLRDDFPTRSPWNYGANPKNVLNRLVGDIARRGLADVVFAAGNGGQFCPDARCGPGQIGPGRSIYGAAAVADVLTVGAVRNDQTWLGYSAQGPAPRLFASAKPDLVAPSQFTAPADAARGYGGTSAACALAAGAIAAARSVRHVRPLTPAAMRARA